MPLVFAAPPLAPLTAHALSLLFGCTYVASIYLSKNARLSFRAPPASASSPASPFPARGPASTASATPRKQENDERWRDDPSVIRARLLAVTLASLACCAGVVGTVACFVPDVPNRPAVILATSLARLGLTLSGLRPAHFLITPLLFLGPLYARLLALPPLASFAAPSRAPQASRAPRAIHVLRGLIAAARTEAGDTLGTWIGVRNLVAAPLTEELVFRACVLAVYQLAGAGRGAEIGRSPWVFGLAHVHHAWDVFNRYGRTRAAAQRAALVSSFQLAYTALFGAYAAFLFLRTGSLLPPLAAHAWCNLLGLPAPADELRAFPRRRYAIIAAYVAGIVLFAMQLGPWTENVSGSLYWARFAERREGAVRVY